MNKKTILTTLLFTTILSSGTVFAMKKTDLPFASPDTNSRLAALPKTDEFNRAATAQYPDDVFSPDSAAFHRGLFIDEERQKREDEKHRLTTKAKAKQINAEQQRALQTAEEQAQKAIDELKAQIEQNRLAKTKTEGHAFQLSSRITNMEIDLAEMEEKVKQEESKVKAEKQKKTEIMTASTKAMDEMKRRLKESRETIAALKEERDQLESTKAILGKREEGLLAQISLFKTHLDSTMVAAVDPLVPAASSGKTAGGTIVPPSDPNIPLASTTILPAASSGKTTVIADPNLVSAASLGLTTAEGILPPFDLTTAGGTIVPPFGPNIPLELTTTIPAASSGGDSTILAGTTTVAGGSVASNPAAGGGVLPKASFKKKDAKENK